MIIDKLINSGILTLSVVLLAIIAIIFLFLKYRQNDGKCKVHMYYISGLLIFIITLIPQHYYKIFFLST